MDTTTREDGPGASTASDFFYRELFADPLLQTFYGDSGYTNLGYWDETTPNAAAAGDRLVDTLLELIPTSAPTCGIHATVLDVACGFGGTTRRLARHFGSAAVTSVGISQEQLDETRRRAPGCTIVRMNATDLQFPDASFDLVCCVEAAFHFHTRERFLAEACRVLKPGGYLVLTDLLMAAGTPLVPPENHLPNARAYEALLQTSGFQDIVVVDVTQQTWRAFRRRLTSFLLESSARYASLMGMRDLLAVNMTWAWAIRASLLAAGRRPETQ